MPHGLSQAILGSSPGSDGICRSHSGSASAAGFAEVCPFWAERCVLLGCLARSDEH